MRDDADRLRIAVQEGAGHPQLIDCGVHSVGGLEAGLRLAEACLAGLGNVRLLTSDAPLWQGPSVAVTTDHPVAACLASQYAGWEVSGDGFFSMGSGPMRAAAGREPLFDTIGHCESTDVAVGILEADRLPPESITRELAAACNVDPDQLTLLVAPTTSIAGTVQVVARSIETALHKLHELGFDLRCVESGFGVAPLPPVAGDTITGIGRTNDAIIYGAEVTLYLRGDDTILRETGVKVPSNTSADYGQPFRLIFERYDRNFYDIDPMLFSPAVITLVNLCTGRSFRFGHTLPRVVHESFGVEVG